jgi:hypothetical protein
MKIEIRNVDGRVLVDLTGEDASERAQLQRIVEQLNGEPLDFHGISRSVLEARIVELVKQLEMALERVAELEREAGKN